MVHPILSNYYKEISVWAYQLPDAYFFNRNFQIERSPRYIKPSVLVTYPDIHEFLLKYYFIENHINTNFEGEAPVGDMLYPNVIYTCLHDHMECVFFVTKLTFIDDGLQKFKTSTIYECNTVVREILPF